MLNVGDSSINPLLDISDPKNPKVNGKKATPQEFAFFINYFAITLPKSGGVKPGPTFGNAAASARQAGCKCTSAASFAVRGNQILRKFGVDQSDVLSILNITPARIARKIDQGLESYKIEVAKHQGKIGDVKKIPDFATQQKYVETAIKLHQFAEEHDGRTGMTDGDAYNIYLPEPSKKKKKMIIKKKSASEPADKKV